MMLADTLTKWTRNEMMLSAETLSNLNVLGSDSSSLLSLADKTVSSFGSRMLRHWLGHPLLSVDEISLRQEAVEATRAVFVQNGVIDVSHLKSKVWFCFLPISSFVLIGVSQMSAVENSQFVQLLRQVSGSGDLEQNIAAIFHRRCGPGKFVSTLKVCFCALDSPFLFSNE